MTDRRRRRSLIAGAFTALALTFSVAAPGTARAESTPRLVGGPQPIDLSVKPLTNFRIGYPEQYRFGGVEYLGGVELWSRNRHFGALSGVITLDDGNRIVAVTDNGFWFDAGLVLDAAGQLIGIRNPRLAPMMADDTRPMLSVRDADAESVALAGDAKDPRLLVSFERDHRIMSFPLDLENFRSLGARLKLPRAITRLSSNRGLESIAVPNDACPMGGALIAIAERDRNKAADIPGWIIGGPKSGSFRIKLRGDYSITDAAFLPDGDLVILERLFNFSDGVGMRIRRIPCRELRRDVTLDGNDLVEADLGYQIDNMEGLDAYRDPRTGATILTLVSDDNRSILQRTLLLRFKLLDPPHPPAKGETRESTGASPL
ncbi:MAG: twin-arginine translocation pathway signal protein [Hyphomicrobiales bacterium]|nr:MAG: twin-arginine translocation pathway signal protein [Hyphomicrobiales bacterium]